MMLIRCPWCGERHQSEFVYGGEAHLDRPEEPGDLSDAEWARYLYVRANPKGCHLERWQHRYGCRRWFNAVRHTLTGRFWDVYGLHEEPPPVPADWDGLSPRDPGSEEAAP